MDEEQKVREAAAEIAGELLISGEAAAENLNAIKKRVCTRLGLSRYLTNVEILSLIPEDKREALKPILQRKPVRTLSGVSVVAIMTAPFRCPHGRCAYCPGGPSSEFGDVPQSYTGREPAAMRAINCNYDPYLQVMNRLEQYCAAGHLPEKVELIIMGGTFPSLERQYKEKFITYAFKAMNDFSKEFYKGGIFSTERFNSFFEMPSSIKDKQRTDRIRSKLLEMKGSSTLEEEQLFNEESSKIRCVALCIETRPDFCGKDDINEMLRFGTTRVELGVQSVYDDVLRRVRRGHGVDEVKRATALLKDSFLKVGYHIMPGLPGSNREMDIEMFRELFTNPDFMPDNLKIYPCMVLKGTELYQEWKTGRYAPLTADEAAEIIAEGKRYVPEWCRIMRVQRDIPTKFTEAGVEITNLRQLVHDKMHRAGIKCRCIRCREARTFKYDPAGLRLRRTDYKASGGTEVFIQAEDINSDVMFGFVRLRIPRSPFRQEILPESAGIRELHVYGKSMRLGEKKAGAVQHSGIGKMLMAEAERVASEEFGAKHIYVIAGVGVREYYKKLGYYKAGAYMRKDL